MQLVPTAAQRLAACTLASALILCGPADVARAITVEPRSDEQTLQRSLYAPPPDVKSYAQQLSDAQPFKTMRGVWQLREFNQQGKEVASGTLTFRGAGGAIAEKGSVVYEGEGGAGRGPWLLKADGFGRSQTG
eukprot:7389060-Prymnesium_polylepis.1